jgi:hypothetical protein
MCLKTELVSREARLYRNLILYPDNKKTDENLHSINVEAGLNDRAVSDMQSSTARTLGTRDRIPLRARMCVRAFLYCVVLCR